LRLYLKIARHGYRLSAENDKTWSQVTLLVPWLAVSEQKKIFPEGLTFSTPKEQVIFAALSETEPLSEITGHAGLLRALRGSKYW
jgi:hypothetical protein